MRKVLVGLISLVLCLCACFTFASCGDSKDAFVIEQKEKFTVGILQPVTHDALDAAKAAFIKALSDAGFKDGEKIELLLKNANGDDSNMNIMANDLVRKCDICLGIGTGASVALQSARDNEGVNIPLLFTAVTDPVSVDLLSALDKPESTHITGTSDLNDVNGQIAMIKKVLPNASKIVIFYTSTEPNSQLQANMAKKAAQDAGLEVVVKTVNSVSEIPATLSAIIALAPDAVYVPTDNNLAANMETFAPDLAEAHILTVVGEEGMLANGGGITLSIDYSYIGKLVGEMAVKLLNGAEINDVPAVNPSATVTAINEEILRTAGLNIEEVKRALGIN